MTLPAMRSAASALLLLLAATAHARYHGREIGALSQLHHGVRGTVYAVDARTLYIHDFHYDGVGPAAFFYVGTSKTPNAAGATRLRDERGGTGPLRRYRGEGVTISLPDGVTLRDVKWFSVWCDEYSVNFGDVSIPRDLEYPKPAKVGALRGVHGVSSDPVVVVDAQTLLVPNFSYDGEAPDAKFWVGRGETPSPQGIRIPDENGKEAPLRKYDKKTIVLTLPGELTVFDIGHFAVWCEAFTVNFGHVVLPHSALANVPPSLKMLGVSPQSRNSALAAQTRAPAAPRVRQKIAKLDATTYRPALALAAGPRATPDYRPATHEHLHRRAYTQTFSQDQLVQVQPSQELKYNYQEYQQNDREQQHQNQEDFYQQNHEQQKQNQHKKEEDLNKHQQEQTDNQQHSQDIYRLQQEQQNQNQYRSQEELYRRYQEEKEKQNQENQKLYHLQRQQDQQHHPNSRRQQVYQSQHLQNPQEHYQSHNQYQEPAQQQSIQYQNEDRRQQQRPYQDQRYQSYDDERAQYQRQLYERQLYEQQRLAYERELLSQRRQEDEEPYRYRLLPYSYQGGR